jgi:hypothetical protein
MPFIVSTLSNTQEYTLWSVENNVGAQVARPATASHKVVVKGGANVRGALHTPEGVLTEVTEDDLAMLRNNRVFQIHEKNGYIKVMARKADPEKVAEKDLEERDESAPLSIDHGDFADGGRAGGDPVAPADAVIV